MRVLLDDEEAKQAQSEEQTGYQVEALSDGDYIVTIRHDANSVRITGDDPQVEIDETGMQFSEGNWQEISLAGGTARASGDEGATMTATFTGNQVRLLGSYTPDGGQADVYLDGEKQLVYFDCYGQQERHRQQLYSRSGLRNGEHELKIVVRGEGNPHSKGTKVFIDGLQYSAAEPKVESAWGAGGGPTTAQRWIMGYPEREDYVDSEGKVWQPGMEFVVRSGHLTDSVEESWHTEPTQLVIHGTKDPELYRHGVHGREFWTDFTVAPGTYHVRLKLMEFRNVEPQQRALTVSINGEEKVAGVDVAATAAGITESDELKRELTHRHFVWFGQRHAVDLVFNDIQPKHGIISIHFHGTYGGEALVQAIEVAPGRGDGGATPILVEDKARQAAGAADDGNLLTNPGFEGGFDGHQGSLGYSGETGGWRFLFAGPSVAYIYPESAYWIHPNLGLPKFHKGHEAFRTHTDGSGHTSMHQEVNVERETKYEAEVWLRADDLDGKGFGQAPSDSAGLWIQELDAAGKVIHDHGKKAITEPTEYQKIGVRFTTQPKAHRVRFILDTRIDCHYESGHVTYDSCVLKKSD
jgi:hypothetical protein